MTPGMNGRKSSPSVGEWENPESARPVPVLRARRVSSLAQGHAGAVAILWQEHNASGFKGSNKGRCGGGASPNVTI